MDFLTSCSFLLAQTSTAESTGIMAWILPILGTLQSLLYVAVGLGFVIFVHELGHFLVAKACGVKCEKFYVGFDFLEIPIPFTKWKIPRSLFKIQIGETEYGIGSLPLGGYVKMLGQDDDPRNAEAEAERTKAHTDSTQSPAGEGLTLGSTIEKVGEAAAHTKPTDPVTNSDAPARPAVAVKTSDGRTVLTDPRSYTAKSVPARMAIISAGVIMNAIFAVIFATIAYKMGVEEIPAGIGALTPGDSAWQAGLEPGEKIIAFGRDSKDYEYLRYEDLLRNVVLNGKNRELAVKVRDSAGKEKWHEVRPILKEGNKFPTVGVVNMRSSEIFIPKIKEQDSWMKRQLPRSSAPLQNEDKIVAVDGHPVSSGAELSALLVQHPRGPLKVTIERTEKRPEGTDPKLPAPTSMHDITVEEKPVLALGVIVELGPVKAIRKDSPAATAGLLVGDQLEAIDGESVGDPLTLGQRLVEKVGQTIKLQVSRSGKDGKAVMKELTANLEAPRNLFPVGNYDIGGSAAAEPLGAAFDLVATVAGVAEGSAEKVKLQKGDELLTAKLEQPKRTKADKYDAAVDELPKLDFTKNPNHWLKLMAWIQEVKPDVTVKLEFKRDGKTHSESLSPTESTAHFDESRGLAQISDHRTHVAKDWSEAFWLGRRETKERIQEVLLVLNRLVTGQLSVTNLSGPPGILNAATKFASNGIPSMLMFLTMLSANLAVINFLPIPVLDGGHMMFLAAEWIRGRPVDADLQYKLTLMGLFFLLSLMIFASAMDVGRFLNI